MNTVIKILAFLIKAHQRVINKLAAKLAVPQLLRKPSTKAKSNPFITKKTAKSAASNHRSAISDQQ